MQVKARRLEELLLPAGIGLAWLVALVTLVPLWMALSVALAAFLSICFVVGSHSSRGGSDVV